MIKFRECFAQVENNAGPNKRGQMTKSWFKPQHLKSAFTNSTETIYCLPGGPLGVEMLDSQYQPPIEQRILEHELHHVRDNVLKSKVALQRQARNNTGNEDAYYG